MEEDLYRKGIAAAEAGDLEKASRLFAEILRQNPKSEEAWLAMGRYVADAEKKEYCLEKALSLNPENKTARALLEELRKPKEVERPFFTEDELSGEWDETEETDDVWGLEEELPGEWGREEVLPGDETGAEEVSEEWDSGQEKLKPESDQKPFCTEDELSGEWDETEEADDVWGFKNELPGDETGAEELSDEWESEEETSYDWGDAGQWAEKGSSKKQGLQSRLASAEGSDNRGSGYTSGDVWDVGNIPAAATTSDKKKDKKGSCLSRIITAVLGLIVLLLVVVVALLALVDLDNPPEIIEPILRTFIPAPTATVTIVIETKEPTSTPTPIRLPPTWTLTPSPIPSSTPFPSPTPTPTITPTPTQEAGTLIVTTDETGWSRYTYPQEEWGVSVPPGWVYFDLNADDFDEMLSEVAETNPYLAEMYPPDALQEMADNDIKFLVVDSESTELGAATNLNIIITNLESDIDFDIYIEENIQGLKQAFGEDLQITEERIDLGGIETAEFIYEVTMTNLYGYPLTVVHMQYLLLHEDKQHILTFTVPKNLFEDKYSQILTIAQSFELND